MYIITPCRNAVDTIAETIESVVNQSFVAPFHYHVQDGLSSDGTQAILAEYQERIASDQVRYGHIFFSWTSESDTGMYDAIAKAVDRLDIPPDTFMGWINADDLLCPDAIRAIQEIGRNLPDVDWVGGASFSVMGVDGKVLAQSRKYSLYPQELLLHGLCDGLHWKHLQQEGTFWRKKIWDAASGLNTRLRLAGDWDLWRRMARHAEYVQLPKPTGIFRERPGQLSAGSGYSDELDSVLSREERRKSLRRLLPGFSSMRVGHLKYDQDGNLVRQEDLLRCSWKERIQLGLAVLGLYRLLRQSLRLNSVLVRTVRT
jgi:hypothetical protein